MKKTLCVSAKDIKVGDHTLRWSSMVGLAKMNPTAGVALAGRVLELNDGKEFFIVKSDDGSPRTWNKFGTYEVEREVVVWKACQAKDIDKAYYDRAKFHPFGNAESHVKALVKDINEGRLPNTAFHWPHFGFSDFSNRVQMYPTEWGFCEEEFVKSSREYVACRFEETIDSPACPAQTKTNEWTQADEDLLAKTEMRLREVEVMGKESSGLEPIEQIPWTKKLRILQAAAREKERLQVTVDNSWWED